MDLGASVRGLTLGGTKDGAQQYFAWFKYEFWRFVFVQQIMGKEIQTFLDYRPMQRGASFSLDAIKAEMGKRVAEAEAASWWSTPQRACFFG